MLDFWWERMTPGGASVKVHPAVGALGKSPGTWSFHIARVIGVQKRSRHPLAAKLLTPVAGW